MEAWEAQATASLEVNAAESIEASCGESASLKTAKHFTKNLLTSPKVTKMDEQSRSLGS